MTAPDSPYLTTRELADLLRIGERKVYDLAAKGEVPCVKVVGKLLFPRDRVMGWIASGASGPGSEAPLPSVIAGSSDPLLDWALRQSGAGLAAYFDGSHDGLDRLARREAMAAALHIHEDNGWNENAVGDALGTAPVVLVEIARRVRGLILPRGNPARIAGLADLPGRRVGRRQLAAASERLFVDLCAEAGVNSERLATGGTVARSEEELALLVAEDKADVAFGLQAMAARFGLDFVPLTDERLDLLFWQSAYFGKECQRLMHFLQGPAMAARAGEMPGYDISQLGRIILSGS